MKIIQIIPGSGGSFYCGNCLRDFTYFNALRKMGHDVVKIPMYLPLFSDEKDIEDIPVFYGAVSIYLKQLYPIFRHAPSWFDQLLNSKAVLKLAANMAGSTNAKGLEDMTVSMLLGEDGRQAEELERMTTWIAYNYQPDIIHISNALLLGIAKKLKQKINVPIVCSLQDEDTWVDVMQPSFRDKVWKLMSEKSADIDAFISVSDYYAKVSKDRMKIEDSKLQTIYLGVDPANYNYINSSEKKRNIGFISRMSEFNGLDTLVDAFIMLKKNPGNSDVKLIVTGGSTGDDAKFISKIKQTIQKSGFANQVEFHKDFTGNGRTEFFNKVSIISVPVKSGEAFGIYLTEAMACGIPVVQPPVGAFPEIINKSGGGIVYSENNSQSLSDALNFLINNEKKLQNLSIEARKSAEVSFNVNLLAAELADKYEQIKSKYAPTAQSN